MKIQLKYMKDNYAARSFLFFPRGNSALEMNSWNFSLGFGSWCISTVGKTSKHSPLNDMWRAEHRIRNAETRNATFKKKKKTVLAHKAMCSLLAH